MSYPHDRLLTADPNVVYFRAVYRRHINFAKDDDGFYKLLRQGDSTYKEGLNKGDALHYVPLRHIPTSYCAEMTLIADVTVPGNARQHLDAVWQADRLVLSNIRPLSEFLSTLDEHTVCYMLEQNGMLLEHVHNQTESMQLAATRQNPAALQFVK
jgi:hypothetical protein